MREQRLNLAALTSYKIYALGPRWDWEIRIHRNWAKAKYTPYSPYIANAKEPPSPLAII